jgi:hypothetical protein
MGLGKSLSMISLMVNNTHDLLSNTAISGTSEVAATLLIVPPSRKYSVYTLFDFTLTSTSSSDMGGAVPKVNVSQHVSSLH